MTGDRFAGRRVLVTGASRGIGAATAARFAAEGADVAITARTLERHPTLAGSLQETADALSSHGARVAVVVADLADETDRARIVPEAEAQLGGPIDVLVNNAAAAVYQPVATYPLRRRRLVFEVNVHAPLDLAQAVIPAMRERGEGWLVSLSSATSRQVSPGEGTMRSILGVYGASKSALERLSTALAVELSGTGLRINTVRPRAAVLSEGANVLVDAVLTDDKIEPMETMVDSILALSDCPPEMTGGNHVSVDLLARLRGATTR